MIDPNRFAAAWRNLLARFGQEYDRDQAAAYLEYLGEQLTTEQFLQAARSLWATGRFFPRPADFVLVLAADQWTLVLEAVAEYTPPHGKWYEPWEQLDDRSQRACRRIGGIEAMRAIYERDVLRLKAAWEQAYEQETAAAALQLPAAAGAS